ncbi:helix-turn-helix transcriptional regulator [Paraliomyxa miuraensis]|uniref:helix-turn-helix transcriptional regulator n=1 Tax=Paraliomyxa miuraensis TaxID=376150 RepID=UPI00224D4110|nr:helix-turn-helix transcriptional regulator [Paraliomyxa miuraensis]MCX4240276.1 helix-turn-helix domain-containing protein [Paraliomyxa miuraensis]
MDPEGNHGGKASASGEAAAAVESISAVVEDVSAPPRVSTRPEAAGSGESAPPVASPAEGGRKSRRTRPKAGSHPNNVRKLRQTAMMSKAELARRAGVSPLTIDRVEAGCPCRMDTKRKILEALGLQPSAAKDVFPDLDLP